MPWFVMWLDGEPEFRVMDAEKLIKAVNNRLCWVCGQKLGTRFVFVAGPMCGLNRTSSEPPSHKECAEFSAIACPFLVMPKMIRRSLGDLVESGQAGPMGGHMITRNPGVTMLWFCRSYRPFEAARDDGEPGILLEMGEPFQVDWYREGRRATREEVVDSIETGLPALFALAEEEPTPERRTAAYATLETDKRALLPYLPATAGHLEEIINA